MVIICTLDYIQMERFYSAENALCYNIYSDVILKVMCFILPCVIHMDVERGIK